MQNAPELWTPFMKVLSIELIEGRKISMGCLLTFAIDLRVIKIPFALRVTSLGLTVWLLASGSRESKLKPLENPFDQWSYRVI